MLNISSENHNTTFQFRKHAYDFILIMNTETQKLHFVFERFNICLNIKLILNINFILRLLNEKLCTE